MKCLRRQAARPLDKGKDASGNEVESDYEYEQTIKMGDAKQRYAMPKI